MSSPILRSKGRSSEGRDCGRRVHVKVLLAECESILPPVAVEAFAKFVEELLQMIHDACLELRFRVGHALFKRWEHENERVLDGIGGLLAYIALPRESHDLIHIADEGQSFVERCYADS